MPDRYLTLESDVLLEGIPVFDRQWVTSTSSVFPSGLAPFTFFTATRNRRISSMGNITGPTAAAATPTLCQYAIYEVLADQSLNRVGITANNTALWAAINTAYRADLEAPVTLQRGRRYACAHLMVSGGTGAAFARNNIVNSVISARLPRIAGSLSSLTELPQTVQESALSDTATVIYYEMYTRLIAEGVSAYEATLE